MAAMPFDDLTGKGKPYSRTAHLIVFRAQPFEYREDIPMKFSRDANAVVAHIKDIWLSLMLAEAANLHNFFSLIVVLQSVGDKVTKHFTNARGIA